jgi:hypothetical protein
LEEGRAQELVVEEEDRETETGEMMPGEGIA